MRLRSDRRGSAALEFALVFPAVLLFLIGTVALYTLVVAKRAMDYGVEKALRYAITHGGGGTTAVVSAFNSAASTVWTTAGTASTVTVTPSTFKAGDTVKVSATFSWGPPTGLNGPYPTTLFTAVTLSADGSMRVMY